MNEQERRKAAEEKVKIEFGFYVEKNHEYTNSWSFVNISDGSKAYTAKALFDIWNALIQREMRLTEIADILEQQTTITWKTDTELIIASVQQAIDIMTKVHKIAKGEPK